MKLTPEVQDLVRQAVREALELFAAQRPVPTAVTAAQAAEMLGVGIATVHRLRLPRNDTGRIPYEAVLAARSAR